MKNSSSKKSSDTHIAHVLWEQVLQGLADSITLCHDSLTPVITSAGWVSHQGSPTNDAFQALLQGRPKALLTEAQGIHNDLFLQRKNYRMSVLISVTSTIREGEESTDYEHQGLTQKFSCLKSVYTLGRWGANPYKLAHGGSLLKCGTGNSTTQLNGAWIKYTTKCKRIYVT